MYLTMKICECGKEYTKGKTLCPTCMANNRRFKIKLSALAYKGGKCIVCGYDACEQSLDFHHLDPATKSFSISGSHCRSEQSLKEELKKCVILCRNHHGELHAGFISLEPYLENDQNIEEAWESAHKVAEEYIKITGGGRVIEAKRNDSGRVVQIHVCPKCLGPISATSGRTCAKCYERPKKFEVDKEELEKLISNLPMTTVGKMFGVSDNAVRKRAKKLGIWV